MMTLAFREALIYSPILRHYAERPLDSQDA